MTSGPGYYICNVCGKKLEFEKMKRITAETKVDLFGMSKGKQWDLCDEHFKQALFKMGFTLK